MSSGTARVALITGAESGMTTYPGFQVDRIDRITLHGGGELVDRDLMSPYVWQYDDGAYGIMVRGVPRGHVYASDTGKIWYGESSDGLSFAMRDDPILAPDAGGLDSGGLDAGGCEDPTLVIEDGRWIIYYTGVDIDHVCAQMLYAEGTGPNDLVKLGIALASSKTEGNTKEATVNTTKDGGWRLFYEYARDDASLIGLAIGAGVAGPWHEQPQIFAPRPGDWDGWHLSPGPLLTLDRDYPVMFYNGATHDAHWRIGWVVFDCDYSRIVARCEEPLIVPPDAVPGAFDIAFAASCVVPGAARQGAATNGASLANPEFWLYYSIEDCALERAVCQRRS
jgi:predicted GH43/DUF377 family glycosyl hydrolase